MIDVQTFMPADPEAAARGALTPAMMAMKGSAILAIAGQVRALKAQGRVICDLTVGDFSADQFQVPDALITEMDLAARAGHTNYPPADGIPELKSAIIDLYRDQMGQTWPEGSVCVASGARPPIYAAWRLFVEPGDRTISFLPMWNVGYYAQLTLADHQFIPTSAATNFFPTVEQVAAALPGTRLVCLNSPLNPTGTVIDRDVLQGISQAIVDENRRRARLSGRDARPVMLLYDQVYWMLTAPGVVHHTPVELVPEIAPYVVYVDAISKCFAATGLRVGWAVLPPHLQTRMRSLIGHIGAWAPRNIQLAAAKILRDPVAVERTMVDMRAGVQARLDRLYEGVSSLAGEGLPISAIAPQGAIYLSLRVDLIGRGFATNEELRIWMLNEAGIALVPFQAFDLADETGWFRASVGAVGVAELDGAIERLRDAFKRRR